MLTVACWGVYGIFLHKGSVGMADPVTGRYKAFLWVGVAYFLVAIVAPLVLLISKGGNWWQMPDKGVLWSLIAGAVGAVGAFGVLLAFGTGELPPPLMAPIVMSIIFAGAPVVNALIALALHPPKAGWASIPLPFYLGILMAAGGGYLVTKFKPVDSPPPKPAEAAKAAQAETLDYSRYTIR